MTDSVSVIIPTYNRAQLVGRAIKSALEQLRQGDEVIVVDDGSTDNTETVLGRLIMADPMLPLSWVRIDNGGPGAARNAGIKCARRPLLAFLDSDDVWLPDSLEMRRRVMESRPELVCAFGDLQIRRRNGSVQYDVLHSVHRHHPRVGSEEAPSLREALELTTAIRGFDVYVGNMQVPEMYAHWVISDTALVRRSLAPDWRFPEDVRLMEDYEAFAHLSKVGPFAYLDTEIAEVIDHDGARLTEVEELAHHDARIRTLSQTSGGFDKWHALMTAKRRLRDQIARGQKLRHYARAAFSWVRGRVS